MTKLFMVAGLTALILACNDNSKDSSTTETSTTTSNSNNTAKRSPAEGDVTYKNQKVMVWKNGNWVEADNDVELKNGVVVRRDGRIVRNGDAVEFREGVVVTREGDFFDDAGNAIEDGWDGVKKAFKKSKEEVKDVLKDDDKKENQ